MLLITPESSAVKLDVGKQKFKEREYELKASSSSEPFGNLVIIDGLWKLLLLP